MGIPQWIEQIDKLNNDELDKFYCTRLLDTSKLQKPPKFTKGNWADMQNQGWILEWSFTYFS